MPGDLDSDALESTGSGVFLKTSGPASPVLPTRQGPGDPEGSSSPSASAPLLSIAPLDSGTRQQAETILRATGVFREDEIRVGMEVLDSYFAHPEQDYTTLGAFTPSGDLLGFSVHGPTPCTQGTWDLYWIAVSPAAQGMGIGSVLLKEVEGRLTRSNARLLVIETSSRPEYDPTRAFYLKRGYREVARVPDFYEAGDHRVIYAKNLIV
jgi:ribosomal protein S18 acetylase RimI-like enzyme